ncbi:MAG: hypothetical protein H7Y36_08360 [Armatimonadetes bacterium]|nr:hypothetical protein [Akkermansiaceae bacterium]
MDESQLPLKIHRPLNNTTILLDPEIPGEGRELKLLTNLPAEVTWTCETLEITDAIARLTEGTHELIAMDQRNGSEHRIVIHVKKL